MKLEGLGEDDKTEIKLMYLIKLVISINVPQFQGPIYSMVTADSLLINATTSLTFTRLCWMSFTRASCLPLTTETKGVLNASNYNLI